MHNYSFSGDMFLPEFMDFSPLKLDWKNWSDEKGDQKSEQWL